MKKLKLLLVIALAVMVIPFNVFASEDNEKVNVYFFRGEGCGYCEAGLEWFDEIEDEYGDMYELHTYETWYDEDNANLLDAVAEAREEDVQGVPYIIIGNQSWNGFDESYEDAILDKIEEEYETEVEERYDVMDFVDVTGNSSSTSSTSSEDDSYADDIAVTVLLLVVVAGVGVGIYSLRKSN